MKTPRNIEVKSKFTAALYSQFRDACEQKNVSQSWQLMDLAQGWVTRRNDRRRSSHKESPVVGHNRAMSLPGRASFASRMSLRM